MKANSVQCEFATLYSSGIWTNCWNNTFWFWPKRI